MKVGNHFANVVEIDLRASGKRRRHRKHFVRHSAILPDGHAPSGIRDGYISLKQQLYPAASVPAGMAPDSTRDPENAAIGYESHNPIDVAALALGRLEQPFEIAIERIQECVEIYHIGGGHGFAISRAFRLIHRNVTFGAELPDRLV